LRENWVGIIHVEEVTRQGEHYQIPVRLHKLLKIFLARGQPASLLRKLRILENNQILTFLIRLEVMLICKILNGFLLHLLWETTEVSHLKRNA
jgi:hypothetical protein